MRSCFVDDALITDICRFYTMIITIDHSGATGKAGFDGMGGTQIIIQWNFRRVTCQGRGRYMLYVLPPEYFCILVVVLVSLIKEPVG